MLREMFHQNKSWQNQEGLEREFRMFLVAESLYMFLFACFGFEEVFLVMGVLFFFLGGGSAFYRKGTGRLIVAALFDFFFVFLDHSIGSDLLFGQKLSWPG